MLNRPTFGGHITFEGGFGRCAPMFLCFAFRFVCKWLLNVTKSSPDLAKSSPTRSGISWIIKIKPMAVGFPFGVGLAGECGSTLEVVVVTEGGGVGLFEVSRLCCRFLLFYNPQTPFEGGFGRCAPMRSLQKSKLSLCFSFACYVYLPLTG